MSLANYIPEVTDLKELNFWCIDKIDIERRIIQVRENKPISLAPSIFTRMLHLPKPTMHFKNEEASEFLKKPKGGSKLLEKYLIDPRANTKSAKIEFSSLKYPNKAFS